MSLYSYTENRHHLPSEVRHKATSANRTVSFNRLDGLLGAHLRVEPYHLLAGDRSVYLLADSHEVALTRPYPEARSNTAEGKGADSEANEFECRKADTMEELVLGLVGWVGTGGEGSEGVEGTTDNVCHEWRDATRDNGSEDGREDEDEEVTARNQ